jgi:hypothetical protein
MRIASKCASASRSAGMIDSGSGWSSGRAPRRRSRRRLRAAFRPGRRASREQTRHRHELTLQGDRLGVLARFRELEQPHARFGQRIGQRQDAAGRADAHHG